MQPPIPTFADGSHLKGSCLGRDHRQAGQSGGEVRNRIDQLAPSCGLCCAPTSASAPPIYSKIPSASSGATSTRARRGASFDNWRGLLTWQRLKRYQKFAAIRQRDVSCLPPHHRIRQTYLPIQVATVAGVQTSKIGRASC